MKAANVLIAAAILLAFACSKSDKPSSDSTALAAKSEVTPDSAATAAQSNASTATTTAVPTTPADTAASPARGSTPTPRSGTTGGSRAGSSGTPSGAARGTTAPAATPVKVIAGGAKTGAAAVAQVAAVPSKPEVKPAPPASAPVVAASVAATAAVDPSAGKILFEENCRQCHGVLGVPPKAMKAKFPKIVTFDAQFFGARSDDSVVKVLTKGTTGDMLSFKDKLSHPEMVSVAAYIRTLGRPH